MATKEKQTKKSRAHKESAGKHGGGGKVRLTPLQKVLLVRGGLAHHTRRGSTLDPSKTKRGRRVAEAAEKRAEEKKLAERKKKLEAEARAAEADRSEKTREGVSRVRAGSAKQ